MHKAILLTHPSDAGVSEETNTLVLEFSGADSPILLRFPLGGEKHHFCTAERAEAIRCLAPPGWSAHGTITQSRDFIEWTVKPEEEEEKDDAPLFLEFTGIVSTGELESATYVTMTTPDGETTLPVLKRFAPPRVCRFVTNQLPTGVFDTVTLAWRTAGLAQKRRLLPHPSSVDGLDVARTGADTLLVTGRTEVTLLVVSDTREKQATARCRISPVPPAILSFTANGQPESLMIRYGAQVTLAATLAGTRHAYLNEGIGRIDGETTWRDGYPETPVSASVTPTAKKTAYTLSCIGEAAIVSRSVEVRIEDFMDIRIRYSGKQVPDKEGNYKYNLEWSAEYCNTLKITAAAQPELSGGKKSGKKEFLSKTPGLAIRLAATGPGGQKREQTIAAS